MPNVIGAGFARTRDRVTEDCPEHLGFGPCNARYCSGRRISCLSGRLSLGASEQHSPRKAPSLTVRSANEHDAP